MWNTGHALVKAKLKETGAPLAGEMSGHTFFKERWYGFDDGLYTGARLLEILSAADANPLLKGLPNSPSTPELNIKMAEGEPLHADRQAEGRRQGLRAPRKSSPSTASGSNTRTVSVWPVRPIPRRWWCYALKPTTPPHWSASRPVSGSALASRFGRASNCRFKEIS
jgi:hypothetical protein